MMVKRRVVITGLGTVNACGLTAPASWEAIRSGKSGIARCTRFDTTDYPSKIVGELKEFDPAVAIAMLHQR